MCDSGYMLILSVLVMFISYVIGCVSGVRVGMARVERCFDYMH